MATALPLRVYALRSIHSKAFHYVGSTILSADDRLKNHFADAFTFEKAMKAVHRWIRTTGSANIELVFLDEFNDEGEAIDTLRSAGHPLLNQRPAGAGRKQEVFLTDDQKARLGVDSDASIAAEIGCSRTTVSRHRRALGIPVFTSTATAAPEFVSDSPAAPEFTSSTTEEQR